MIRCLYNLLLLGYTVPSLCAYLPSGPIEFLGFLFTPPTYIIHIVILIFLGKLKCLCVLVLIYSHFSSLGLSPSKFDHRQRIKSEYHMSDVNVCCNTEGEELCIVEK